MSNGLAGGRGRRRLLAHERSHEAQARLGGARDSAHGCNRAPFTVLSALLYELLLMTVRERCRSRGDGRLPRRWEESWEASLRRDSPEEGAVVTCSQKCASLLLQTTA